MTKIACILLVPKFGDLDGKLGSIEAAVYETARATFVTLTKQRNPSCFFESRDKAFALADPIPDRSTCRKLTELVHEQAIYNIFSDHERSQRRGSVPC